MSAYARFKIINMRITETHLLIFIVNSISECNAPPFGKKIVREEAKNIRVLKLHVLIHLTYYQFIV